MTDDKNIPEEAWEAFEKFQVAKRRYFDTPAQDQSLTDGNDIKPTFTATMPVLPQEDKAEGNLTDQVAKESSDSTASSHPLHGKDDGRKATIEDYKAPPGIAISEKLPEASSKEELKKRFEELNKK